MRTRELARAALFAALIAICSWISIPTAVPFTLQTFAVFLALGVLGGKLGTLSVAVYLLLGAVGLPVFAGFQGGLGALLGATGGYLAPTYLLSTAFIIAILADFGEFIMPQEGAQSYMRRNRLVFIKIMRVTADNFFKDPGFIINCCRVRWY